jgi:glycosyltransferase involved in cell wall biosynthesis
VAATPVGDTPDIAEASQAIALLPVGDPAGQAAILGALLDDHPRRDRMRTAALEYSARFRWDEQKERYWSVLASAAGARA